MSTPIVTDLAASAADTNDILQRDILPTYVGDDNCRRDRIVTSDDLVRFLCDRSLTLMLTLRNDRLIDFVLIFNHFDHLEHLRDQAS
jgi:hypothetical protein